MTDDGIVAERSTTVPRSRATTNPPTPPGRVATTRASPPRASSSHSAGFASSASPPASTSGRVETKSRPPSGRNAAVDSPLALRVSRRGSRRPCGSSSHSALPYVVRAASIVATDVTSRSPSGLSASPPNRGSAR
ncbi:hypothetical protein [Kineosporia sp. R_H_3]|uniref:hypothetical protein n=1 Tax=Kineosporia sp. R_H_3 TaxID=1961848 RepID=UPI000B4C0DED|nr:hypothetical protein [Kineosporia sp. R_H_3]